TFAHDGVNVVEEFAGGSLSASLLTGLNVDEAFSRTESGTTRFFLPDALGSTVALTDSTGMVQTEYTYEPFGRTTVTGAASSNSQQFTGRENDGLTGLYYYRARYYHPVLQRFISEDPIGFAGGDVNLYAYTFNSPTNLRDPNGLIVDTLVDFLSIVYDAYRLYTGGPEDQEENLEALGLDIAGAAIPGVTCLGAASRAARRLPTKTDRLKEHLTQRDLDAARREARGEVVARRPDGSPFNHIEEVQNAQQGLLNRINQINRRLSDPNLSSIERVTLQRELGKASRLLDSSERFLPR
ncbi:MAG: polymorphic toxin type 28 domain-containing protein, partial [Candidatus Binatia bacterium]